ncbi:hypothetical protein B9Z19DRAFT_1079014 [Tuber borchii]|uniref:Uncharacterized protein n=1 Tax=Tuber borchii TaxID=42251 RepID=A0A2T6ZYL7_TUBBO|nr:hypothetical protein B9Z19DRAFT_1079014 [Tuber borchii]
MKPASLLFFAPTKRIFMSSRLAKHLLSVFFLLFFSFSSSGVYRTLFLHNSTSTGRRMISYLQLPLSYVAMNFLLEGRKRKKLNNDLSQVR